MRSLANATDDALLSQKNGASSYEPKVPFCDLRRFWTSALPAWSVSEQNRHGFWCSGLDAQSNTSRSCAASGIVIANVFEDSK